MKKVCFIIGAFLISATVVVFHYDRLFAVSGCCKERYSHSGTWVKNGINFNQCEQINAERDRDNLFDEEGYVWWDVRCR